MRRSLILLMLIPFYASAQQIDTLLEFGPDTVMYTLDGKATTIDAYYMNTALQYTGYAQYYDAPQELEISGFCFYAWVENAGLTADVICSLHEALTDSLPGAVVGVDTVTVDDTFSSGDLEVIRYCAEFDVPVVRDQPYVLSVQTNSALDLNIISNDAANEDGADEALAMYYWSGTDPGWRKNETFFPWDIDWVLCPIVNFEFAVQATFDADTLCQNDTINVSADTPAIFSHRMYNKSAFNTNEWQDVSWLIAQNPPYLGYSASAPVQDHGDVPIDLFVEFNGWRNTTIFPLSSDIYSFPKPVAGFDHIANQLQVQFNDTSLFADSVHWDFGDGSLISNESMPIHDYASQGLYTVQFVAYNNCGSDTTLLDIQLMTTGIIGLEQNKIRVFPNPASDVLNVQLSDTPKEATLQMVDVLGRVVFEADVRSSIYIIELDGTIISGNYHLRLIDSRQVITVPVIISK